jgi:mannose/fructose/N-acetylgalactosamine-specific phosphotransferase system component IID
MNINYFKGENFDKYLILLKLTVVVILIIAACINRNTYFDSPTDNISIIKFLYENIIIIILSIISFGFIYFFRKNNLSINEIIINLFIISIVVLILNIVL